MADICIYGAASDDINEIYLKAAYDLGYMLAKRGFGLVFGGGATGVMGAAARGAKKAGGKIIGIAPTFFDKPGVLYKECDEFIFTKDMRSRKEKMESLSDAFISMPGGFGTMEEYFEMFTAKSLGLHEKPVVLANIGGFYDDLARQAQRFYSEGFTTKKVMDMFFVSDDIEKITDYIASLV